MNARTAMLLIAALFILSPITAWLFHLGVFEFAGDGSKGKNAGDLIHPARPLQDFKLQDGAGSDIVLDDFLGQWTMLQFAANPCVDDCMENVYKMRQIRLAAGKDAHRMQRVLISETGTDVQKLMDDNPGTRSFRVTAASQPMLTQFPGYTGDSLSPIAGRIYIVDPLGNLMMQYPKEADPSAVLKDLRQLLKATWIRPRQS